MSELIVGTLLGIAFGIVIFAMFAVMSLAFIALIAWAKVND